jgi:hypothetical protein
MVLVPVTRDGAETPVTSQMRCRRARTIVLRMVFATWTTQPASVTQNGRVKTAPNPSHPFAPRIAATTARAFLCLTTLPSAFATPVGLALIVMQPFRNSHALQTAAGMGRVITARAHAILATLVRIVKVDHRVIIRYIVSTIAVKMVSA